MANRLADETSPYLRQHAENPVDWFPWGSEAFETARAQDRPVLLSVGYSACHWCHVMAHESFEDPATAALMNQWFVNIKVDREERPDIDAIYMEATQAMTGQGGWPMTVFMTAEGEPFFCGTYFPATEGRGQPTFTQLLEAIHGAWLDRRPELMEQAERLVTSVRRSPVTAQDATLPTVEVLDEATMSMLAAHDAADGGFGGAPKFPQSMSLDHLLRHHRRTSSETALAAAVTSLDAMAAGGIYDHLGGGFSRYSVDAQWLVPHFEKMLYDNALLVRTYLHAWQVTGEDRFAQVCTETIDYVLRDLSHPDGGRYSAQDADSVPADGGRPEEGAFYVWRPEEVAVVLEAAGLSAHVDAVLSWYGITEAGNFDGAALPNRLHARGELERPEHIEAARRALLRARDDRPHPGLDDKVLTEWNGLWVAALAEAGAALGNDTWLHEAERTAAFLIERLRVVDPGGPRDGRWLRSWQADLNDGTGGARLLGYASDYAAMVDAFLSLYEATGALRWLEEASRTADGLIDHFWDSDGGVWTTGDDAEQLVTRPKDVMDGATPSANSLAAVSLLRLGALTGAARYDEHARSILRLLGPLAGRHALAFGHLLHAVSMQVEGITEVVVTGERPDLVHSVHRRHTPNVVLAWGERGDGPLWEGRNERDADGRAYVCTNQVCAAPVRTTAELEAQLG